MAERFSISIRDRHGFERSIPINRTVTLGRQNQCDIVLSDSMVSRNHLRIEEIDGEWWAEDLGSSHGSYFRDARLTRIKWEPGATVRLADGAYYLTLRAEAALAPEVNLQAILQTAHLLTGQVELDDLLEQTLERLLSLSNTDRGFIMLPESGDLVVKVARNLSPQLERDIHLSMSSVRRVFEKGEPIWIHNVASDEKLMAQQSIMDLQLKTILCLPLMVQGNCIGVAYLDSRRIVTEPVDRATFEAIVSLCAIAIERTRLSEDNLRNQVLATVGQVASSIVHDFKNALFVVAGHAQMMQTLTQDEKTHHHLTQILGAVDRLSALSGDVLDYSKVREPKREEVDLHEYIGDLLEPHRARAGELGATIRCEGPVCKANLDPFRFARVVENLLANSLDALNGREDGEVVIRWCPGKGDMQISVQDNGKGIPRKIQKRIFEPFFSHGKVKGTGLGMATVKKIIEEHGGSLEVLSEEDEGTSVNIWIPDNDTRISKEDTTDRVRILNPDIE
ncbi:MAG: FHA domain-containing protein [Holophaga sp.]|nr:FHA domain-containing protein [Holophaga sp.]